MFVDLKSGFTARTRSLAPRVREDTGELDDVDGASSSRAFVDVAGPTSRARSETIEAARARSAPRTRSTKRPFRSNTSK